MGHTEEFRLIDSDGNEFTAIRHIGEGRSLGEISIVDEDGNSYAFNGFDDTDKSIWLIGAENGPRALEGSFPVTVITDQ